jgi:hypothetical protein
MGHKKSTEKNGKVIKRSPQIQVLHKKVISLSKESAVLANQLSELAVPTNVGQLRNQKVAGFLSSEKPAHHSHLQGSQQFWHSTTES